MTKQILIDTELLEELIEAQYNLIYDYKLKFNDRLNFGRWNQEVNDLISTYNKVADILEIEKMELVTHD